jgi:uncharacterized membrane protein
VLCYFLPALYNTFGLIDGEHSNLYFIASRYLLPATLVLLTLAIRPARHAAAWGPKRSPCSSPPRSACC